MSTIYDIAEFQLKRVQGNKFSTPPGCEHTKVVADDTGETLTCQDCGKQVSAYWFLMRMSRQWGDINAKYKQRWEVLKAETEKQIHHHAALVVESAWRSRTMVPTCPHCGVAIFPDDGFGGGSISREWAEKARAARKLKKGGAA